jgi:hypothetical protein
MVSCLFDHNTLHLYEAEFTPELLHALARPSLATKHVPWPTIKHTRIPFRPYNTFKQRVLDRVVTRDPQEEREDYWIEHQSSLEAQESTA